MVNERSSERGDAILVTGGSGFVGKHVVDVLSSHGKSIVSMYHHRLPETQDGVFPICSDMSSPELLMAPLRGVKTVVHLAWQGGLHGPESVLEWDPGKAAALPANIQILRNLISAMEKAGTQRIVFLSAMGASRQSRVPFLMEKYLAEFFIVNSKIPEKVILRSGVIWGGGYSEDRFLSALMRVTKFPVYPVPNRGSAVCPVHIDELAPCIANLATTTKETATSINEIGSKNLTVEELLSTVVSKRVKKTRLPLRGFLGDSLLTLFERDRRKINLPRLKDYLAVGATSGLDYAKENPISGLIPESFSSFSDKLPNLEEPVPS